MVEESNSPVYLKPSILSFKRIIGVFSTVKKEFQDW